VSDTAAAWQSIEKGSQSFAAAARLFPPDTRDDVARLYAWCRHADDVIDGQDHGHGERPVADPAAALATLREKTAAALAGAPTGEAVFDGFGHVARTHGISPPLANDLLDGFARDVAGETYPTLDALAAYAYGVAGSVGVMMALVLGVAPGDRDTLDRASDLGLAFQMTNIARDVVADANAGRVYLPADWLAAEGLAPDPAGIADPANAAGVFRVAARLIEAAEPYYRSAEVGMSRLPLRAAWAIAAAARVYRAIGTRRLAAGPAGLATRASTSRRTKAALVAAGGLAALRRSKVRAVDRTGLWTRPPRP